MCNFGGDTEGSGNPREKDLTSHLRCISAKWGFETFLWEIPGDILPLATSKPFLCSYTGESGDLVPVASSIAVGTYAGNTRQGLNVVAVGIIPAGLDRFAFILGEIH